MAIPIAMFAIATLRISISGWSGALLKLSGAVTLLSTIVAVSPDDLPDVHFTFVHGLIMFSISFVLNAIAWCSADFGKLGYGRRKRS